MTPDGVLRGWLRHSAQSTPAHVQVLHRERVVAEAVARDYRRDLLLGGHGHGHYGFLARLRVALPPGPCSVVLHLPVAGSGAPMAIRVPSLAPARPATVEQLVKIADGWTAGDLLARPGCLDMAAQHAAQGAARFVDSLYRFVLDRWPSPAEARLHMASLDARRIDAEALLVELLTSQERADMAPGLPGPYDPDFPFSPAPEGPA